MLHALLWFAATVAFWFWWFGHYARVAELLAMGALICFLALGKVIAALFERSVAESQEIRSSVPQRLLRATLWFAITAAFWCWWYFKFEHDGSKLAYGTVVCFIGLGYGVAALANRAWVGWLMVTALVTVGVLGFMKSFNGVR